MAASKQHESVKKPGTSRLPRREAGYGQTFGDLSERWREQEVSEATSVMITPITSAAREAPESERDGYAAIRERFELGNVLHDADGVMIYQGVDRDTNYEISDHGQVVLTSNREARSHGRSVTNEVFVIVFREVPDGEFRGWASRSPQPKTAELSLVLLGWSRHACN